LGEAEFLMAWTCSARTNDIEISVSWGGREIRTIKLAVMSYASCLQALPYKMVSSGILKYEVVITAQTISSNSFSFRFFQGGNKKKKRVD